jgi:hypothetical protein
MLWAELLPGYDVRTRVCLDWHQLRVCQLGHDSRQPKTGETQLPSSHSPPALFLLPLEEEFYVPVYYITHLTNAYPI